MNFSGCYCFDALQIVTSSCHGIVTHVMWRVVKGTEDPPISSFLCWIHLWSSRNSFYNTRACIGWVSMFSMATWHLQSLLSLNSYPPPLPIDDFQTVCVQTGHVGNPCDNFHCCLLILHCGYLLLEDTAPWRRRGEPRGKSNGEHCCHGDRKYYRR